MSIAKSARYSLLSVALLNIILSIIIITLCPRFGWRFGKEVAWMDNTYYFSSSYKESGDTILLYENRSNNTIKISYNGRFSHHLKIYYDNALAADIDVKSGARIVRGANTIDSSLTWVLSDILSKDASGNFYFTYIKSVLMVFVSFGFLLHVQIHKDKYSKTKKTVSICFVTTTFIFSLLFSFRIL